MKQILYCFLCIWAGSSFGQTITIRDQSDGNPLEYVSVYDEAREIVTSSDSRGQVDASAFMEADTLYFQLIGYKTDWYAWNTLEAMGFKVEMEEEDFTLEEVVISASRWEQSKSAHPARVLSVRPQQVEFSNPQTAADLLGSSGEVFIQKSQLGGGSPMIRGFAANRVLISIDGVRMNNAIFRSGNLQNIIALDPFALERAEVIFGPGSILYGSDALGGVMSFYTKTPHIPVDESSSLAANAYARYSSANAEKTAHLDLNYSVGSFGFVTSASYTDFDDQRMGSQGPEDYLRPEYVDRINGRDTVVANPDPEVQVPGGYSQLNLMQKILFRPSDELQFQYNLHVSTTSDVPRYGRLIVYRNGQLMDGEWYYGPQKWQMHQLMGNLYRESTLMDKLRVIAAYQRFGESRHNRSFGSDFLSHRDERVDVLSLNLDFEKDLGEQDQLFYGIEGLYNKVHSSAYEENLETSITAPINTRYPDGAEWHSYAAYVNYAYRPSGAWAFLGGVRYNRVIINAEFDTTFFPFPFTEAMNQTGALNGSLGTVYKPCRSWQLKLNLSTGFRAPNIDDIGKVFDSEPGAVVVPNPDLDPEYAWHLEFGLTKQIDDLLLFDLSVFSTFLEDALVRRDYQLNGMDSIIYDGELSRVEAVQNAALARVWGFQAGLEWKITDALRFKARYNFQDGYEKDDQDAEKVPLRHAAPPFGLVKLEYKQKAWQVAVYGEFSGEIEADDLAPSEQLKPHLYAINDTGEPYSPSWYTLNLKASYRFSEQLEVFAGLENITDQRYRPYSSGIAAPGRNLIVAAKVAL